MSASGYSEVPIYYRMAGSQLLLSEAHTQLDVVNRLRLQACTHAKCAGRLETVHINT